MSVPAGAHLTHSSSTLLGADPCHDVESLTADVALYGVPWDAGSVNMLVAPGARFGPTALRRNNVRLGGCVADARIIDLETGKDRLEGCRLADLGDVDLMPSLGAEENFERVTEVAQMIASRDAMPLAVGGDHSISFPAGRGAMSRYDSVAIVHLDAHADFDDEFGGSKLTHGSNLRRLSELPNVQDITALGLRHVWRSAYEPMLEYGVKIASSREMFREPPADVVRRLVPTTHNIYVSIDIDVLEASTVPGTFLPEPGGLTYNMLIETLAAVATRGRVIGVDIAEINPMNDVGNSYSMAARVSSWVLFEFLAAIRESLR